MAGHTPGLNSVRSSEHQLDAIMRRACEERLFPSLINSLEESSPRHLLLNNFRKKVWHQYSDCLRIPQVYQPGQQLTEWQKVQRRIRRITERRVPIEYLEMNKDSEGRFHPTYRGKELDEVPVSTKGINQSYEDDFKIFTQFNEQSFRKHAFDGIFEDKLELKQLSPVHNPYPHNRLEEKKKELQPLPQISTTIESMARKSGSKRMATLGSVDTRRTKSPSRSSRMKTSADGATDVSAELPQTPRLLPPPKPSEKRQRIYTNFERALTGRVLSGDNTDQVAKIFYRMGGYSGRNPNELLTKESITKYLKRYYDKPHRIIDFLEIPPVLNLESFALLSKRLKVMPRLHFNFMAFLFYDTNHDGIICEGDLSRLQTLTKKLSILTHDYDRLVKIRQPPGVNTTIEKGVPEYLQLYNLPEVTESVIFEWFKSHGENPKKDPAATEQSTLIGNSAETDSLLVGMFRKKYSIRFDKFNAMFRHDKPTLWYELMFRLGGLRYEGITYTE